MNNLLQMPTSTQRVGFIGLGQMGAPMAAHLLRAGFKVVVHDRRNDVMRTFLDKHGGDAVDEVAAIGRDTDVVITMLPSGLDVQEAVLGSQGGAGAVRDLARGAVVIDMGSSDPTHTRALGEQLRARGLHMVDAPVAGGVVFARDGSLDIMVGGEVEVIERCRPIFDVLGTRVHICGGLGNGHAMKALNNFVNATSLVTLIEALSIGRRLGLGMGVMIESLSAATTGRNHPLDKKIVPQILSRRFAHGSALGLMRKDVGIALDAARAADAWAPIAECCSLLWEQGEQRYGDDSDQTEIAKLWEERTGVRLQRED